MSAAADFREIAEGVFVWSVYEPAVKCDCGSTAFVTSEGLVLVDPIELVSLATLANLHRPCAIILTSGNHERAAAAYREQLGVPIFAPSAATEELLALKVNHVFAPGDLLPGGLQAIALSSAGPGEVAIFGDGVLCMGDALINLLSTGFALLPEKYCVNPGELRNDVRKLLSYDFHILTFAHGDPIAKDAKTRLQQLLA